jgi:predicted DNA-binding protein YlxM (UPF0122 family)
MAAETSILSRCLSVLKHLNTSMQGPKENILTSTDKLLAFKNKLQVWKKNTFQEEILKCFRSYFRVRVRQIIRKSSHYQPFGITDRKP